MKPGSLHIGFDEIFNDHVELAVVNLVLRVQSDFYYKSAFLQKTTALGILKVLLGRTIGLHYKHCYERYDNEGGDSDDDVLIQVMVGTKNGLIAVGVVEIGNDVRQ